MDRDEQQPAGGRPAVTVTDNQTDAQSRQDRQANRISDMERLMRGAVAFTRRQD